jgi:hypothetical protein
MGAEAAHHGAQHLVVGKRSIKHLGGGPLEEGEVVRARGIG